MSALASAQELPKTTGDVTVSETSPFLNFFYSIFSPNTIFSVVGNDRGACGLAGGNPNVVYSLGSGATMDFSGFPNSLFDVFTKNGAYIEYPGSVSVVFTCTPAMAPCTVQQYICSAPEPTSQSSCPSGTILTTAHCSPSTYAYRCPDEHNIDYYLSSYKYCQSSTTVACYYKQGGTCYSNNYPEGSVCSDMGTPKGFYQGMQLFSSRTTCEGSTECSNQCTPGIKQCSGNSFQTCTLQSNGCYNWNTKTNCASTETCTNGVCVDKTIPPTEKCTGECDALICRAGTTPIDGTCGFGTVCCKATICQELGQTMCNDGICRSDCSGIICTPSCGDTSTHCGTYSNGCTGGENSCTGTKTNCAVIPPTPKVNNTSCLTEEKSFYSDANLINKESKRVLIIISSSGTSGATASQLDTYLPGFKDKYYLESSDACCDGFKPSFVTEKSVDFTDSSCILGINILGVCTGKTEITGTYSVYKCIPADQYSGITEFFNKLFGGLGNLNFDSSMIWYIIGGIIILILLFKFL